MTQLVQLTQRCFRLGALAALGFLSPARAQLAPSPAIELTPHRAIYELSLDGAGAGSNIADIRGQLTYDFSGSACAGYTLNTRLVTEIFDREGKPSVTDIRSESWEQKDGERFRFNTSQYLNNQLSETTKGLALRRAAGGGRLLVELEKPKKSAIQLPGQTFFPTQHSLAILKAALDGRTRLQANLYDGSEKGAKVYETTTVIGRPLAPDANAGLPVVKNAAALDHLTSWPVIISYYDDSESKDGLPTYEISFRMYANGVSRKLRLDYGTFSLTGELSSIEFSKPKACAPTRAAIHPIKRRS